MLIMADVEEEYLSSSEYIDWMHPAVMAGAEAFKSRAEGEVHLVQMIYEYVRDEIKHSWDVQDKRVTRKASEVLEHKVGICWAKSNLLAAFLRACGIPAGICYQRLTLGDTPDTGFCIHSLNAVYIKSIDRWIRLDARGSAKVPNAKFCLEREQLEFQVKREIGEVDFRTVYAHPSPKLMKVLEENEDALWMYEHRLPDTLYEYRRAAGDDLEELVKIRLTVLRAANGLSEAEPLEAVERGISHISLEATEAGRPLYQKYGFQAMKNEMELAQFKV